MLRPNWDPVYTEQGKIVAADKASYHRPMSAGRIPSCYKDPSRNTAAPFAPGQSRAHREWCLRSSVPRSWYHTRERHEVIRRDPKGNIVRKIEPVVGSQTAPHRKATPGFWHQLAVPKGFWVNGERVTFGVGDGNNVEPAIPAGVADLISFRRTRK